MELVSYLVYHHRLKMPQRPVVFNNVIKYRMDINQISYPGQYNIIIQFEN